MTKRKKILIGVLTPIVAAVLFFVILCFVTMGMVNPEYLGRVLTHFDSDVNDIYYFPSREILASENPYRYQYAIDNELSEMQVEYYNGKMTSSTLDAFVKSTASMSFIIVKNDKVVYEKYNDKYSAESFNTSFSMSKSVVSMLVGKAIEDGYIKAVNQPISDYISEFKDLDIGKVTIEQLLLMHSNIDYEEDKFLWFGDDSLTYWHPDLRKLALEHTNLTGRYNGKFHYNNYHPLLLGIILERCTGASVSEYFEKSIWHPIGAEYAASWSLDSNKSAFEKMESGINFRAIDFIKIGSMVLHGGNWNGRSILGAEWLSQSTLCEYPIDGSEYTGTFLENRNIGYKYMWYCYPCGKSNYDVIAWGKSDQILYVSPANNVVILRTGEGDGGVQDWVETMSRIAAAVQD